MSQSTRKQIYKAALFVTACFLIAHIAGLFLY